MKRNFFSAARPDVLFLCSLFWAFMFTSCEPEQEDPYQIRLVAKVPEVAWTNQKQIPINASNSTSGGLQSQISFEWSWLSVPGGAPKPGFENPRSAITFIEQFPIAGTYRLQLRATDPSGASVTKEFGIQVFNDTLADIPLKADAGDDLEIYLPQYEASLSGERSRQLNPENRLLFYKWTTVSKPAGSGDILIYSNSGANESCRVMGLNVTGRYRFQLQLENELGKLAYDTVDVLVKPDSLAGKSVVYEGLAWETWGSVEGALDRDVFLLVLDELRFNYRNELGLEVRVWNEDLGDWNQPNLYAWDLVSDDWSNNYLVVHNIPAADSVYYSVVGKRTKVKVDFR